MSGWHDASAEPEPGPGPVSYLASCSSWASPYHYCCCCLNSPNWDQSSSEGYETG